MRYIALLRGINVGRAKRVAMGDLRAVFEKLGGQNVTTILNSGNVVFDAKKLAADFPAQARTALESKAGVSAAITVISGEEFERIISTNPFIKQISEPSRCLIAFFNAPAAGEKLKPLLSQDWGRERIALGKGAAYLLFPEGILEGRLFLAVDRVLGDLVTTRNWGTIQRIKAALEKSIQ